MGNSLSDAYDKGQSMWLDYIQKSLLDGELQALISQDKIMGLTSNPAIFEQAIAKTSEYDETIAKVIKAEPDIKKQMASMAW